MAVQFRLNDDALDLMRGVIRDLREDAGLPNGKIMNQLNFALSQTLRLVAARAGHAIERQAKLPRSERTGKHAKSYHVVGLRAVRSSRTGRFYRRFGAQIQVRAERAAGGGPVKGGIRLGSALGLEFGNVKFRRPIRAIQNAFNAVQPQEIENAILRGVNLRIRGRERRSGKAFNADTVFNRKNT